MSSCFIASWWRGAVALKRSCSGADLEAVEGHCHLELPEQLTSYKKLIYSNELWIKTQVASVLCQGESVPLGFHRLLANTTLDVLKGL